MPMGSYAIFMLLEKDIGYKCGIYNIEE